MPPSAHGVRLSSSCWRWRRCVLSSPSPCRCFLLPLASVDIIVLLRPPHDGWRKRTQRMQTVSKSVVAVAGENKWVGLEERPADTWTRKCRRRTRQDYDASVA